MLRSYVPILILMGLSIAQAIGLVALSQLTSPTRQTVAKSAPYESGILPLGTARDRFSIKFYLVAILFIVFDLETVFLIPWAVAMRQLGWSGFAAASIFVVILTVGLIYEWKRGGLRWE